MGVFPDSPPLEGWSRRGAGVGLAGTNTRMPSQLRNSEAVERFVFWATTPMVSVSNRCGGAPPHFAAGLAMA
jgi:hypothetical protein